MKRKGTLFLDGNPFTKISDAIDISFDNAEIPEYMSDVRISNPAAAELTLECEVNTELLKKIAGIDLGADVMHGCTLEMSGQYSVQKRRHRKRRINKKWAKRYGYKTKFKTVSMRDCTIKTHDDCSFEVMGY